MIAELFGDIWSQLEGLAPNVIASLVVLIAGWIAGRFAGRAVAKFVKSMGFDSVLRRTLISKVLERSRLTVIQFFDLVARWLVYLGAVLIAINMLRIGILTAFAEAALSYLPHFVAGVLIILIGLVLSDFLGDAVSAVGEEADVEYTALISTGLRFFLYFVVIIVGLSAMKVDVFILQIMATAIAITVAIGVGGAVAIAFGFGLKDYVAKNAPKWFAKTKKAANEAQQSMLANEKKHLE